MKGCLYLWQARPKYFFGWTPQFSSSAIVLLCLLQVSVLIEFFTALKRVVCQLLGYLLYSASMSDT